MALVLTGEGGVLREFSADLREVAGLRSNPTDDPVTPDTDARRTDPYVLPLIDPVEAAIGRACPALVDGL